MKTLVVAALLALAEAQAPKVTVADLATRTYDFGPEDKRTVTLEAGIGKEANDSETVYELMTFHAAGDLDGDKVPDVAAMLAEHSSGTGHFYYLFVFLNRGGTLVQIEHPEWLGDRSVIQRVTITKGIVAVKFVTHRDRDPACCPTRTVENRYRVVNGKLVGLE